MLLRLFLSLLGIGVVAAGLGWADYSAFLKKHIVLPVDDTVFTIQRGWSMQRVSQALVEQNIIDQSWWFEVHARLEGKASRVKSGEYVLTNGMTPSQLLDLFISGQSLQYSLTIIEGSTYRQMRKRIATVEFLEHDSADLSDDDIMQRIGKPGEHPEGQFFADTYRLPRDSSELDFLRRASLMLDRVLAEEWAGRAPDLPLETPYQALILSSIVEKETAVAEERPLIAAVFLSRLTKNMRLQTDPTVIYGIGEKFDGNIRRSDLQTDTPYNTYTRGGLPPTPIALVGRESIHAVLHPTPTTALYFVSKGDGTHQFSDTVEQHNAAVRKYQLKKSP